MFIENESNCHGCCHHEQIIESDVYRMLFSYFTICIMVMLILTNSFTLYNNVCGNKLKSDNCLVVSES